MILGRSGIEVIVMGFSGFKGSYSQGHRLIPAYVPFALLRSLTDPSPKPIPVGFDKVCSCLPCRRGLPIQGLQEEELRA